MWVWVAAVYATVLIVLTACAGYVGLFVDSEPRANRAFNVLKLMIAAVGGSAGVLTLMAKLSGWL